MPGNTWGRSSARRWPRIWSTRSFPNFVWGNERRLSGPSFSEFPAEFLGWSQTVDPSKVEVAGIGRPLQGQAPLPGTPPRLVQLSLQKGGKDDGLSCGRIRCRRDWRGACRVWGGVGGGADGLPHAAPHPEPGHYRLYALQPFHRGARQGPCGPGDRCPGRRDGAQHWQNPHSDADAQYRQGTGRLRPAGPSR